MLRSRWLVLTAGWSLFGVLQALTSTVLRSESAGLGYAFLALVTFYLPLALAWAVLTPVIGISAQCIKRAVPSLWARILVHLPLVLAAAALHTALRRALIAAAGNALTIPFHVTLLYFADLTIASYIAAVWAWRVLDTSATLSAKERYTDDLRRALLTARMEYLDLQLRPHFLFNALSTIAELAHEAPAKAAHMLRNVIALLDSAIAPDERGLVSLDNELETLRPYLDIQRLRFADWLVIDESVSQAARSALVPRFILQPLVENAVQHGLAGRSARGHIAISARLVGERLQIKVTDNGAGLAVSGAYRERRGVGLANLRARLDAVYGSSASLELRRDTATDGRCTTAQLDLPLRFSPSPAARTEAHADEDLGTARDAEGVTAPPAGGGIIGWATTHPVLAAVIGWSVIALLRVQHSFDYLIVVRRYSAAAMTSAVRFDVAVAALWLAMTPLVLAIARRMPLRRNRLPARLVAHAATAFGLAYGHAAVTSVLASGVQRPFRLEVVPELYAWNVAVYAIILVMIHSREVESWIRDRDALAQRLRRELSESRFRRVTVELRPRVLLETLRSLERRVTEDPTGSEYVLAGIGDFLRRTLNTIHDLTIPLRVECETVQAYARVLSAACVPGLRLELAIPHALLHTHVPSGVLRVALDSVLAEGATTAHVRLVVAREPEALAIHATACFPGGESATRTSAVPMMAAAKELA